ncbi:MAG: DUF3025 domain-containing protein [Paraglaciecola chathamensis]
MPFINLLATNFAFLFMSLPWNEPFTQQLSCAPLARLEAQFILSDFSCWPNAQGLNTLKQRFHIAEQATPDFIDQDALPESEDYYEQIIFKHGHIPTRANGWHDLFNGLVWLQYPATKKYLNQLHVEDIEKHGLSPRSRLRNHITHFDECGVVLAIEHSQGSEIAELLGEHRWSEALFTRRSAWGLVIHARMFGHANYEMLLNPFIGLTGKWLAVSVKSGFAKRSVLEQNAEIDAGLHEMIRDKALFEQTKPLLPIPLLGIPAWCEQNQVEQFYQNRDYFRPKRINTNSNK